MIHCNIFVVPGFSYGSITFDKIRHCCIYEQEKDHSLLEDVGVQMIASLLYWRLNPDKPDLNKPSTPQQSFVILPI